MNLRLSFDFMMYKIWSDNNSETQRKVRGACQKFLTEHITTLATIIISSSNSFSESQHFDLLFYESYLFLSHLIRPLPGLTWPSSCAFSPFCWEWHWSPWSESWSWSLGWDLPPTNSIDGINPRRIYYFFSIAFGFLRKLKIQIYLTCYTLKASKE